MKYKITPILVQEKLAEKNIKVFTPEEFRRVFEISPLGAKYFLENYTKKSFFVRLKKGLYALKSRLPAEEEIANALYRPSYLSFEYILAKYGIIPEMVYTITCATTKPTRQFIIDEKEFAYYTIKKSAFIGYSLIKEKNKSFLIAEPEKAIVDYFYFVSLGRKKLNDRINISGLKKEKIIKYAKIFERPRILDLIKKL